MATTEYDAVSLPTVLDRVHGGGGWNYESVTLAAPPAPGDTTAPTVGSFSPALGGTISPQQPISFSVTDDSGSFRRILIHARFADGLEEVVYNGDSFRGLYATSSARVIATGGFDFTILRTGGWPQGGPVAINVFAIDVAGNEAA